MTKNNTTSRSLGVTSKVECYTGITYGVISIQIVNYAGIPANVP